METIIFEMGTKDLIEVLQFLQKTINEEEGSRTRKIFHISMTALPAKKYSHRRKHTLKIHRQSKESSLQNCLQEVLNKGKAHATHRNQKDSFSSKNLYGDNLVGQETREGLGIGSDKRLSKLIEGHIYRCPNKTSTKQYPLKRKELSVDECFYEILQAFFPQPYPCEKDNTKPYMTQQKKTEG